LGEDCRIFGLRVRGPRERDGRKKEENVFLEREGKEICFVVRESGWRNERNRGI